MFQFYLEKKIIYNLQNVSNRHRNVLNKYSLFENKIFLKLFYIFCSKYVVKNEESLKSDLWICIVYK